MGKESLCSNIKHWVGDTECKNLPNLEKNAPTYSITYDGTGIPYKGCGWNNLEGFIIFDKGEYEIKVKIKKTDLDYILDFAPDTSKIGLHINF